MQTGHSERDCRLLSHSQRVRTAEPGRSRFTPSDCSFASVALLISTQYASYGIEELPRRLNNCVDDLSVYKKETDEVTV